MKQKGFTNIYLLIGIILLAIPTGAIFLIRSRFEISDLTSPVINSPVPQVQNSKATDLKTYSNPKFNYELKYPSTFTSQEREDSDTYLSTTTFKGAENEWFSLQVRESTLDEEINLQRSKIEGHILVKLANKQEIKVDNMPSLLLEYLPENPGEGLPFSLVVTNNKRYSYSITGDPKTVEQVIPSLKFLDEDQKTEELPKALDLAKKDLAAKLKIDELQIITEKLEETLFNDSSLGCPEEGKLYLQVITSGYKAFFNYNQNQYEYHTDKSNNFVECKPK